MNYQEICEQVCDVARQVGAFIAEQRSTFRSEMVELKGRQNLVSYVDKQAEKMIVARLQEIMPQAGFITEEGTVERATDVEYCWIVDPLDGTTNFVHGMPPYCVSIALQHNRKTIVGVVYEITIGECFYAWEDSVSYVNGQQIHTSQLTKIEDSLVITGLAYNVDGIRERFNELFDFFNRNSHGARRLGSAATDLVYVAAGRAECFYQANLSPWDVAAGAFIVERAGGRVTDFQSGDDYVFGKQIVATNGAMHQTFLDVIKL